MGHGFENYFCRVVNELGEIASFYPLDKVLGASSP